MYVYIWGRLFLSLQSIHYPWAIITVSLIFVQVLHFILFRIILATQLYAFPCKFENKMVRYKKPTGILVKDSIQSVDPIVDN